MQEQQCKQSHTEPSPTPTYTQTNQKLPVLQDPSELRCPLVPLTQTGRLVSRLVEILPENHAQYSLALHLLEAVEAFSADE